MTETAEINLKSLLDPMTRSVLNHPNIYGASSLFFWLISAGCLIAMKFAYMPIWLVGAAISGLVAATILGVMIVAVRRAKRLVAAVETQNKAYETEPKDV